MLFSLTLQHAARYYSSAAALALDSKSVSYAELAVRVDRLAALLHGRGLRAGDRLAMLLLNCPEFVEIVYACARLGVIIVPLNTRYAAPEIDAVLSDCQPKGILRHSALPKPSVSLEWDVVIDETPIEGTEGPLPPVFYDPEAIFGLFYTSGTTGCAKGVMLTHQSLLANIHHCRSVFDMKPGECCLHAAPMFHLADFPCVLSSACGGACQATVPRFELQGFCAAVQKHKVTHTVLIPTMVNFLTLYPELNNYDLSSLTTILYGGSPIAPEVLKRARLKFPRAKFYQGYGLTEASPVLTVLADEHHTPEKLLSCGLPPFGVEMMVMSEDGKPAPVGQSGEIAARGLNIMKGYWNQPEATAAAIRDGCRVQ